MSLGGLYLEGLIFGIFRYLSIRKKFGSHVTVRHSVHLSVCTTEKPMKNLRLSSKYGSLQPDIAHSCSGQLTAVKTGYPLTNFTRPYRGLRYQPIEITCFWSYPLRSYFFYHFAIHTKHTYKIQEKIRQGSSDSTLSGLHCFWSKLERFSYDLEMKTRKQNRKNKRTEIERFDWFIERIKTRVALSEKTSGLRTF